MPATRTSFKQWYARCDRPVPLKLVGSFLSLEADQVRRAIRRSDLHVLTFRAEDGRVLRFVPFAEVATFGRNPLMTPGRFRLGAGRALRKWVSQGAAAA